MSSVFGIGSESYFENVNYEQIRVKAEIPSFVSSEDVLRWRAGASTGKGWQICFHPREDPPCVDYTCGVQNMTDADLCVACFSGTAHCHKTEEECNSILMSESYADGFKEVLERVENFDISPLIDSSSHFQNYLAIVNMNKLKNK